MAYKAEYIWIDGTEPTRAAAVEDQDPRGRRRARRSGASTARAPTRRPGDNSDCVLQPVFVVPRPDPRRRQRARDVRGAAHRHDAAPDQHPGRAARRSPRSTPTRSRCSASSRSTRSSRTAARSASPPSGFPAPQGCYYCGVGADEVFGRDVVEAHLDACLDAGLAHLRHQRRGHARPVGVPGRPARPARRSPTSCGSPAGCSTASPRTSASPPRSTRSRSRATGTAPARTPTSRPRRCARATTPIIAACEALGKNARRSTSSSYGAGIEDRLTGLHETAPWNEFSYGVSDRGASVRIPWQVEVDKKGYIEDRRPNANMDPYVVTRLITDTVCSALAE